MPHAAVSTPVISAPVISADDHIDLTYVPADLFQTRLPQRFREAGPRVVDGPDGPMWIREDRRWGPWGSKRADNKLIVFDRAGLDEQPEPGVWRATCPRYRLADMDAEGVYAQVLYNFLNWSFADRELKAACARAFNDWLAEEMCAAAPDRLIGLATLPDLPSQAGTELARAHKLGLRGGFFEVFSAGTPIFDDAWTPLWEAAADLGCPITVHSGTGSHSLNKAPATAPWRSPANAAVLGIQLEEVLAAVMMAGVLDRHPKLKFVLGESGIGWIPHVLERLDFEVANYAPLLDAKPYSASASEIFRRQVYATFTEDRFGLANLDLIGEENVMWAADYPHGDGAFPHSQAVVARQFAGMDPAVTRKVTWENAARLYCIDGSAA
jgi:predicted TIM-barrel fold metal-dependent hydrolase